MKWTRRHVLDTDDWSRDEIETVLDQTRAMTEILQRPIRRAPGGSSASSARRCRPPARSGRSRTNAESGAVLDEYVIVLG